MQTIFDARSDRVSVEDKTERRNEEMDTNGITPVMPVGNGGDGWGGNSFMGIFGLLILLGLFSGGFGGFGGGNQQYATRDQVQNGFDNQNMQAATSGILTAVTDGTSQVISNAAQNNSMLIREFGTVETALAGLTGQMQNCCGETKQMIMQSNYDGAMRDAATNANISAQIQSIKDVLAQNKIEALQAQVSALQLQAATSNVLRFPNAWTYAGGVFPPVTTTPAA